MAGRVLYVLLLLVALSIDVVAHAAAQELAERGPRFLAAWAPPGKVIDASEAAPLRRRVSLDLTGATLEEALKEITRQANLEIAYGAAMLRTDRLVALHARDITVAAALTEVLLDAGVDVSVSQSGQLVLASRPSSLVPVADSGDIVGTVRDSATDAPIPGATVVVEGTSLSATTDAEGQYRIGGVPPGSRTIRIRFIGYSQSSAAVEVVTGREVTADVALGKSVQQLDEVVTTTPGGMQSQVRAIPSPVTVITSEDIERQRPQTLNDVFRQAVPSAVAFDQPASPVTTYFALRGASTLDAGGGQVKVIVDGIQTASMDVHPVDPSSIERIEVIRGPQAATIYGPDAAGGVMQIFTKRGSTSQHRPEITAEIEAGVQQTPYPGFKGVTRQSYNAFVRGGSSDASYNLGVSYWRLPTWTPDGQPSTMSAPSASGGVHFEKDLVTVDISGRYLVTNLYGVLNPALASSGVPGLYPNFQAQKFTNQTISAQVGVTPRSWWINRLTVGTDHYSLDQVQQRPTLTEPADTFLQVVTLGRSRVFASYNTSLRLAPHSGFTGSLTAGVDYYRLPVLNANAFATLNTSGTIRLGPDGAFGMSRTILQNTGYFAQVEVGLSERLFLSGGLRADRNPAFGQDHRTVVSPRVGVAYTREFGGSTIKLRSSFGRAIRAPGALSATGLVTPSDIVIANPALLPERQEGWDGGLDVLLGSRGSLGITGYHQTAEDLIVSVTLAAEPTLTRQFQNLGRVSNRGLELEARWNIGPLIQIAGQYAYVRSRIESLGPTFAGDERVGDRTRDVPAHTAGGTISVVPRQGTSVTAGVTYVGSFREYDYLAEFGCFGETVACPASFLDSGTTRDFIVDYPGFTKVSAAITQQIMPQLSGTLSVKNLTNNLSYENFNLNPVRGRLTSVAFQWRY